MQSAGEHEEIRFQHRDTESREEEEKTKQGRGDWLGLVRVLGVITGRLDPNPPRSCAFPALRERRTQVQKSRAQVQMRRAQVQKCRAQVQMRRAQVQKSRAQVQMRRAQVQKCRTQVRERLTKVQKSRTKARAAHRMAQKSLRMARERLRMALELRRFGGQHQSSHRSQRD
jgi:chromosome segregation ATPase